MTLSDIAIKRPVFAWMLMAALIVFGWISFQRLGVSQMPDVDFPVLTVTAEWEGAAPEIMEAEIADRIEQAVISVQGLTDITSSIRQGRASVTLEFSLDRDVDAALQEVQSAVSKVRLPRDVDPPTITKTNPDDQPIMYLGISSEREFKDLIKLVELSIRDQFQTIPGVGEIVYSGFADRSLRIWLDNEKLKANELTVLDLVAAIERGHIETAAGVIENDQQELNLRVMGEGISPEQVGEILITQRGGRPIFNSTLRIKDVGRVENGLVDIRRLSRVNGVQGVGLGIKKQRGANAVDVAKRVRARLDEVSKTLPKDVSIGVNFDSTVFIEESIRETNFTLVLSAVLTALVCWLFLGSIRPTFNILLSIPTSIIGSFMVIYFMGFTLNFFTILGLALAIGIVVDDAIMVLENIYRHRDMGKDKVAAATDGAREITFAAVAATIAVVAIFLPIAFMKGIIGRFFFQFGITISAAVLLSLLEAVTLTPMRCAEFLESGEQRGRYAIWLDSAFARLAANYRNLLGRALRHRWLVILGSVAIFAASLGLFGLLRKEFIPAQDQSMFMVRFQTPVGSSLAFTNNAIREGEAFLKSRPEVRRYFLAIGGFGGGEVNTGIIFVSMVPRDKREIGQAEFMNQTRDALLKIKDLKVFVQDLSLRGFTAQRGFPVEVNIRGGEWPVLEQKSQEIIKQLEASGLVTDIDTDYRLGQPEVRIWPLREEAAKRGIPIEDLGTLINAAIGGVRQGKYTQDGRRYDVRLRLEAAERLSPEDIFNLQIRNVHGELVPIRDVIKVETVPSLQVITRRNRERSIAIYANVAPGKSQGQALDRAMEIGKQVLPEGYRMFLGGGAQTFIDSFNSLTFVLWLGLAVAYMVLASQFNSFLHPFAVLLSLPFSVTGAFVALYLTGQSINLYSMIGIVLLMGIVKKNAILLVEFANKKRFEEGLPLDEAILAAAPVRLRPILMTSLSTMAAAIPPALALGPGAESRIPMAITVLGGTLVSTMFTLFVVPCAYRVMARLERVRSAEAAKS